MSEKLIKPYEISVWEDKLIQVPNTEPAQYNFEEKKLAVIGSDTMTGLNKVYNPVFHKNANGEKTLSFSMKYKYFDPYTGNEGIINPFVALLTNERKVKLKYDGKWYEFIVKEHTESSEEYEWTYNCTDAFVLELSKNGYNLTFDNELNNNQGTASELAGKVLEDTDWQLGESDLFKQLIEEPVYLAELKTDNGIEIINASGDGTEVPSAPLDIYLFYTYVKNKDGKYVQFIIRDENRPYIIDDKNVITDTNFRITTDLTYDEKIVDNNLVKGFWLDNTLIIEIGEAETKYQVFRLGYNQLTTYDPVMERTVDRFGIEGENREIYRYIDYLYTTSNVVLNYITNGDNFNLLEDGSLQGWNPYVDFTGMENSKSRIDKLELVTKPELGPGKALADISTLSQIEGFLKVKFKAAYDNGKNAVYNSGFENNTSSIKSVSEGDKFVFRWRAGQRDPNEVDETKSDVDCLVPATNLRAIVAKYTQDEPNRWTYYYRHINTDNIVLEFSLEQGQSEPEILNNIIDGGTLQPAEENSEELVYVIDDMVQTPSTKYIYINEADGEEYIWNGLEGTFDIRTEDNYLPYYYLTATASKALPNSVLKDPTQKYGIFIYATSVDVAQRQVSETFEPIIVDEEETYTKSVSKTIDPKYDTIINVSYTDVNNTVHSQNFTAGTEETVEWCEYDADSNSISIEDENGIKEYTIIYYQIKPFYIQDIQLTRLIEDANGEPIVMGNIPIATSAATEYYYIQPVDDTAAEDVIMYTSLDELINSTGISSNIEPLYNENSEKNLTISASKSNCFDILQTIAETFECWIDLYVEHEDNGAIRCIDGIPQKYVYLREYSGEKQWAGFRYGINLKSIEREVNSTEFVTKLIVDQSQSEYVDEGYVSIASAPSNTSGESYILNFDYYYNQGLLNREEVEADRLSFTTNVANINTELQEKEQLRRDLEASMVALGSKRDVFTELINSAKEQKTQSLAEFEDLTNRTYDEYKEQQDSAVSYDGDYYVPTGDTIVKKGKNYYIYTQQEEENVIELVEEPAENPYEAGYYEQLMDLTEEDTVYNLIGEIYVTSATINNYSGILTNIEQEYWSVRKQLRGNEDYNLKVWTAIDALDQRHVYVELSDYLPGFKFEIAGVEYESTVSVKYFDITTDATEITFTPPDKYSMTSTTYTIVEDEIYTTQITRNYGEKGGLEAEIEEIRERKNTLVKSFNNKYSRFIQEGTWNSTDYIDSELYYLDALQVSNTSAQPTVSYTISVVEISQLEGFEWYLFDAGDKSYVEDTEFFGWANVNGILTPAREEVIVAEVEWHLDEPSENVITVQNYKTRFEDFFQRISATVQTVQYNEATYAKISSLLDLNGTINQDVLLESLNNISGKQYNLTSDGSIIVNEDVILVQNLTNPANRVIINSEGIRVSSDGGNTWATAIDGQGINIGTVYTGTLNTNEVIIGSKSYPSFRWDKAGISAYHVDESNVPDEYIPTEDTEVIPGKIYYIILRSGYRPVDNPTGNPKTQGWYELETESFTDLKTFVRFDEYGLYGIKNADKFKAQQLSDILDKAHFAVTWDGFFIKNSYADGGRVSITSDNDFQVTKKVNSNEQEVIKIGMLEERANGNLYGMRIKDANNNNAFVADSDGNLSITGVINATGGNFSDIVTVGKNTSQTADYIIINGETASISSSNYNAGPTTSATQGWIINKDGDAIFNNITARGAIKTAVFEYAEIQAVGGVFIFRPSSTIRSAAIDGNNLVITVEKPMLFKADQWCKVSNYTADGEADNPDSINILNNNGLAHVYKVSRTQGSNNITLLGAAAMVSGVNAVCSVDDLIGGSLVDMGNKIGTSNYGIGINSSDNTVNLPARAISLFETIVDETHEPKVTYNYRGILGTLPPMSSGVNSNVYQYMQGTQGIYTDNMYIGDGNQYIAFYTDTDDNDKKKLKINAKEIIYEIDDSTGEEVTWEEHIGNEVDSNLPIEVRIESNTGNMILTTESNITLTCTVWKGNTNITNMVTTFTWTKIDKNGIVDTEWVPSSNTASIVVDATDIVAKAIFVCTVEF